MTTPTLVERIESLRKDVEKLWVDNGYGHSILEAQIDSVLADVRELQEAAGTYTLDEIAAAWESADIQGDWTEFVSGLGAAPAAGVFGHLGLDNPAFPGLKKTGVET